jgi:hypothetical protein
MGTLHLYAMAFFLLCLTSSCRDTPVPADFHPRSYAVSHRDSQFHSPSNNLLNYQRALCKATPKAYFDEELLHCSCPAGFIFQAQRGCRKLSPAATAQPCIERGFLALWEQEGGIGPVLSACLDSLYNEVEIRVDGSAFSSQQQRTVLEQLDRDYFSLARRYSSNRGQPGSKAGIFINLTSFSLEKQQNFADLVLRNFRSLPTFGRFEELPQPLLSNAAFSTIPADPHAMRQWREQCRKHIATASPQAEEICLTLQNALKGKYRGQSELQMLDADCAQCTAITSFEGTAPFSLRRKIFLKDQVPIIRYLRLDYQDLQVNLYLAGDGSILGLLLASLHIDQEQQQVQAHLRGYDSAWQLVYRHQEVKGDAESIHRYLAQRKHRTDEQPPPVELAILLIESGVNPLLPAVGAQLALNPQALAMLREPYYFSNFLEDLQQPLGLDLDDASPLQRLLFFFDNKTFESGTGHGTTVASVVLKDLPATELYVLPPEQLPSNPRKLADYIRLRNIRIVNISQMFDRSDLHGQSCKSYFTRLYQMLPEVVFVAAAGNTGSADPDVCPGRSNLEGNHSNAVTIAGSQDEHLHARTSFGIDAAHGAAPFTVACRGGPAHSSLAALIEPTNCTGTSYSAALVSNALGHYALQHPDLTGRELASALLATCGNRGLPLRCGGIFDLTQLLTRG